MIEPQGAERALHGSGRSVPEISQASCALENAGILQICSVLQTLFLILY
jgi:hypothetical protein